MEKAKKLMKIDFESKPTCGYDDKYTKKKTKIKKIWRQYNYKFPY